MDDIEIPSFFICPISLEIMKDPVTLPTGITYDRESIEKWMYSGKNRTCPVTKQAVNVDSDLTPNHTVRRLIQSWCTLNVSKGVDRIATPKPPVSKSQVMKLLSDAKLPNLRIESLQKLRLISNENDAGRRCIEACGGVDFLASLIAKDDTTCGASDEALCILHNLNISEACSKTLLIKNYQLVESLTRVMRIGSYESRVQACILLSSLLEVADPIHLVALKPELYVELVQILKDQISQPATKAVTQLLINVCSWGRNKAKVVDAGAVAVTIDLLLEHSTEKRSCEMMLTLLDKLCTCAEGRADLLKHGAGLAIVSKKILRVSQVASERGVRILYSVAKFSASPNVLQDMLYFGVVTKLCLVLQVHCGGKIKEKASEILKLHSRVWKNSPCIPVDFLPSYP